MQLGLVGQLEKNNVKQTWMEPQFFSNLPNSAQKPSNFSQICPILPKSHPICHKFAQNYPKAPQFFSNLPNFAQKPPICFQLCPKSHKFFLRWLKSIKKWSWESQKVKLQFCSILSNFVQLCEKVEKMKKMKKYKRKRGPTQRAHFTSKHVPLTLW